MKNDKILLLEQLYMAAHVIDTEGRILWANNFEMSQLGYLPADYVGHKFSEVRAESFPVLRLEFACFTLRICWIPTSIEFYDRCPTVEIIFYCLYHFLNCDVCTSLVCL